MSRFSTPIPYISDSRGYYITRPMWDAQFMFFNNLSEYSTFIQELDNDTARDFLDIYTSDNGFIISYLNCFPEGYSKDEKQQFLNYYNNFTEFPEYKSTNFFKNGILCWLKDEEH